GLDGQLFPLARHLVRLAAEKPKPNAERLREYRDSALESLELQLFSPAPIHADEERVRLGTALTFLAENLGGAHPLVRTALGGKSPFARADELLSGTRLFDAEERMRLAKGGAEAVNASQDPLVRLAAALDPAARALRTRYENEVEEPERQ